jgi:hypothetical protein
MAYVSHTLSPSEITSERTAAAPRLGWFARFIRATEEARLRRAELEVAQYMARTGGRFTDATERELERRLMARGLV